MLTVYKGISFWVRAARIVNIIIGIESRHIQSHRRDLLFAQKSSMQIILMNMIPIANVYTTVMCIGYII